jgi:hypothetical protein
MKIEQIREELVKFLLPLNNLDMDHSYLESGEDGIRVLEGDERFDREGNEWLIWDGVVGYFMGLPILINKSLVGGVYLLEWV